MMESIRIKELEQLSLSERTSPELLLSFIILRHSHYVILLSNKYVSETRGQWTVMLEFTQFPNEKSFSAKIFADFADFVPSPSTIGRGNNGSIESNVDKARVTERRQTGIEKLILSKVGVR